MKTTGSDQADGRATPRRPGFSLAANYDLELVPALAAYPWMKSMAGSRPTVSAVASPLPGDATLGNHLRNYIRVLDRHGIAFNYLLNGACFGNREWTRPWQKQVTALLARLGEMGVRRVTVSTRFFWNWSSAVSQVQSESGDLCPGGHTRRAIFWRISGGCHRSGELLDQPELRRLSDIRQAVRCDLELIANHVCLMNCPMQTYHQNGFAHASDDTGTLFIDYCFMRCSRVRMTIRRSSSSRPDPSGGSRRL